MKKLLMLSAALCAITATDAMAQVSVSIGQPAYTYVEPAPTVIYQEHYGVYNHGYPTEYRAYRGHRDYAYWARERREREEAEGRREREHERDHDHDRDHDNGHHH